MSDPIVHIIRRADNSAAPAQLLEELKPEDLLVVEGAWASERSIVMQELLNNSIAREKWPQSLHWSWREKARELTLLETCGHGIFCEQQWQGVMLTKTASAVSRLGADRGKMTPIGRDASKQNLLYYELSTEEAARHLTEGGAS